MKQNPVSGSKPSAKTNNFMKLFFSILFLQIILTIAVSAQTETLNNQTIILMTQAGLGKDLIIKKINSVNGNFDVSAQDLIALKKAGVDDDVIKLMLEKAEISAQKTVDQNAYTFSDNSQNFLQTPSIERIVLSPQEALKNAKTVAIQKSSLYPSTPVIGEGSVQTQGLAEIQVQHRAAQGRRGFVYRNRSRSFEHSFASLRFPHLRPPKRNGFDRRRNDLVGRSVEQSGA